MNHQALNAKVYSLFPWPKSKQFDVKTTSFGISNHNGRMAFYLKKNKEQHLLSKTTVHLSRLRTGPMDYKQQLILELLLQALFFEKTGLLVNE